MPTQHASMQENNAPPRVGRDALVAHEAKALARAASVRSECVRPGFLNGERIGQEQFFHDPSEFQRSKT